MADKEARTEEATPRKREKAREEGQVPVSSEVIALAVLGTSSVALYLVLGHGGFELLDTTRGILGKLDEIQREGLFSWTSPVVSAGATLILPVAFAGMTGAVASGLSMTRLLFSFKIIEPKFSKFNPLPALQQMFFSKSSLIKILQAAGKVAVIGAFTFQVFWDEMQALVQVGDKTPIEILTHTGMMILVLSARVIFLLVVFAALDLVLARRRHNESLKMSKDEVRDEHKQHEADPQIKRRQRQLAQKLLNRNMLKAVPQADVVLVNPTHYSVALRYDAAKMPAPAVIAKGEGKLAAQIRDIARANRVPVVHNPPLTRKLFAEVKVGHVVPENLFAAVAQILAYVYRLRGRAA